MDLETELAEIGTEQEAIRARLDVFEQQDNPSDDDITRSEADIARWDELAARATAIEEELEKIANRAARLEQIRNSPVRESGFHAPQVMVKRDPLDGLDSARAIEALDGSDARARVATVIENSDGIPDSSRQAATVLAEKGKGNFARYMLHTAGNDYRSAFEKYLENPEAYQAFLTPGEAAAWRTAMSTTAGNGGYAIPFLLDPSIILTATGTTNPFRKIARHVQGTSNKWQGLTSAGVSAQWLAENAAAADASPTLGQPSITAYKGAAWVFGSYEVFEDTNLASELPGLIMDAKDRLEASAFAIGSGSGAPYGIVTRVAATTASRVSPTTGGVFTASSRNDVDKTFEALPDTHQGNASWVANQKVYGFIRRADTYGGGNFWANLGGGIPAELLGVPTYQSVYMDSTMTTGANAIVIGDFSNYVIYDRIGLGLEYIPNQVDGSGYPTLQRGWVAHWRTGADSVNHDAFRVLQL